MDTTQSNTKLKSALRLEKIHTQNELASLTLPPLTLPLRKRLLARWLDSYWCLMPSSCTDEPQRGREFPAERGGGLPLVSTKSGGWGGEQKGGDRGGESGDIVARKL